MFQPIRRKTKEISTEAAKYYPDEAMIEEEMERVGKAVSVYEITIEHLAERKYRRDNTDARRTASAEWRKHGSVDGACDARAEHCAGGTYLRWNRI
ncbi:MAG: hypothetical protein V8T24_07440 [Roseburia hominis]